MNAYIFVLAAVVAVMSVLFVFKMHIDKAIKKPQDIASIQKEFFIGIALSKIVPVILLIYGIIKMTSGMDIRSLYIPWLIIIAFVIYALFYISSKNKLDVDPDTKFAIRIIVTIALPLVLSIPLMAALFLFLMTT